MEYPIRKLSREQKVNRNGITLRNGDLAMEVRCVDRCRLSRLSDNRLYIVQCSTRIAISAEKATNPPAKLIFGRGMNAI